MGRSPWVLITSPEQASAEEDEASNGKETTHEVDLSDDFAVAEASRVYSWWGVVEDGCHNQSDESPNWWKGES